MNLNDIKKMYNNGNITLKEYERLYIDEIKARLNKRGLTHKQKTIEISKVLKRFLKLEVKEIKNTLDDKRITMSDILPVVVFKGKKSNNDFSMRLKKSKGVTNRHCYR